MKLVMMCGPCGSGKSTYAKTNYPDYIYVNQDSQGKEGHIKIFTEAISNNQNIIIDRMSFNKQQRDKYLVPAKAAGYKTKIVVLHESQKTCLDRMLKREGHETITDEKGARSALHTFFSKYERPALGEADEIEFVYPEGPKPSAVICDLDGTLCNIDHRLHFVRGEGKKDWKNFLYNIPGDSVNSWCLKLVTQMSQKYKIVYCSGRGGEYRGQTMQWLKDNYLWDLCAADWIGGWNTATPADHQLYMRERGDHRTDWIIKETILDFELLTRFTILFAIDDRQQVVDMWRRRGVTALQCAKGDF